MWAGNAHYFCLIGPSEIGVYCPSKVGLFIIFFFFKPNQYILINQES